MPVTLLGPPPVEVSLREMLEAMAHLPEDAPFRWYQTSRVDSRGIPQPEDTLLVTMGQARREVLR